MNSITAQPYVDEDVGHVEGRCLGSAHSQQLRHALGWLISDLPELVHHAQQITRDSSNQEIEDEDRKHLEDEVAADCSKEQQQAAVPQGSSQPLDTNLLLLLLSTLSLLFTQCIHRAVTHCQVHLAESALH